MLYPSQTSNPPGPYGQLLGTVHHGVTIPRTTDVAHVLRAIEQLREHVPELLSDAGRAFWDAERARIRGQEQAWNAGLQAQNEAALRRAGHLPQEA